jgi:two-component system, OmpR family, KDP operon response regulator KdpE
MNPEAQSPSSDGKRRKILVVDDNAVIVKTLTLKLTVKGYDVCTALDGAAAIRTVRQEKPDLILLDLGFPPDVAHGGGVAWDGFLIMDWVHRNADSKNTPIIVISRGEPTQYEKRSLDAGAVAFFHKPIDHEGLINVIRRTLGEISTPPIPGFDTAFTI